MFRHLLPRALLVVLVAALFVRLPLPGIPGAHVSLKNAVVALACVVFLGKLLYDTLFQPRGPWGLRP